METSAAGDRPARISAWAGQAAALPAGALVALVTLTYTMSYAALMFSGGLAPAYPAGLACLLVGCAIAGVVTALASSIPFNISAPDSNVVAILAAALAPLARTCPGGSRARICCSTSARRSASTVPPAWPSPGCGRSPPRAG